MVVRPPVPDERRIVGDRERDRRAGTGRRDAARPRPARADAPHAARLLRRFHGGGDRVAVDQTVPAPRRVRGPPGGRDRQDQVRTPVHVVEEGRIRSGCRPRPALEDPFEEVWTDEVELHRRPRRRALDRLHELSVHVESAVVAAPRGNLPSEREPPGSGKGREQPGGSVRPDGAASEARAVRKRRVGPLRPGQRGGGRERDSGAACRPAAAVRKGPVDADRAAAADSQIARLALERFRKPDFRERRAIRERTIGDVRHAERNQDVPHAGSARERSGGHLGRTRREDGVRDRRIGGGKRGLEGRRSRNDHAPDGRTTVKRTAPNARHTVLNRDRRQT